MNMRVLFDESASTDYVGKKLNYLSMGEVLDEENTSISRGDLTTAIRGAGDEDLTPAALPDPAAELPFSTDTRIAMLGNLRVWELAACMITAFIILMFVLIAIMKIMRRIEYERSCCDEDELDESDREDDESDREARAKQRAQGRLFLTRSSAFAESKSPTPSEEPIKTDGGVDVGGSSVDTGGVHLSVRNFCYSNQCLQLDRSDLDSPSDSFA